MNAAHILIVEDEPHLAQGIADNLRAEGYQVTTVGDGEAALQRWQQGFDLIILDVMLPQRDGYTVCAAIRAQGGVLPVLFLSAKNSDDERVHGLSVGGNDYLGKPFDLRELLLRVHTLLRRQSWQQAAQPLYQVGSCQIDPRSRESRDLDGRCQILPAQEFLLLQLFVTQPNQLLERHAILRHVWGDAVYPASRTIAQLVQNLRQRFETNPQQPRYFHTVPGEGYRFTP